MIRHDARVPGTVKSKDEQLRFRSMRLVAASEGEVMINVSATEGR